jgi:hypothetical protein
VRSGETACSRIKRMDMQEDRQIRNQESREAGGV